MSLSFRVSNVTALGQRAVAQALEQGLAAFLGPSAFSVSVLSICTAVPRACVYETRSTSRLLLDALPRVDEEEDEVEDGRKEEEWHGGRHSNRHAETGRRGLQAPSTTSPLVTVTTEILFANTASVEALTRNISADPTAFVAAVGSALTASNAAVFGAWVATSVAVVDSSSSLPAVAASPSGAADQPLLLLLPTLIGAAIGVGVAALVTAAVFALRRKLKGRNAVAPAPAEAAELETRTQVIRIFPQPPTASGMILPEGGIGLVGGGGSPLSPGAGPRVAWAAAGDNLPAAGGVVGGRPPGAGAPRLL
jgi:hypothetical protein